uniref:Ionotropic glutamate receptor L-glutamate and glycine-binding domain-containing protein n=1 Tax=Anopheles coluzzii TaxID=1518534 RepID=A0A6E8WBA8_ANOCL
MVQLLKLFMFLIVQSCCGTEIIQQLFSHLERTISMLKDSAISATDVWYCLPQDEESDPVWFVPLQNLLSSSNATNIIVTLSPDANPVLQIIDELPTPIVMVVFIFQAIALLQNWLIQVAKRHTRMKIIFVVKFEKQTAINTLMKAMSDVEYHNVLYLAYNQERNIILPMTYHPFRQMVKVHPLDDFQHFFPYHGNYYGRQVNVSCLAASPYIDSGISSKQVAGIDIQLLTTFGHVHGIKFRVLVMYYPKKAAHHFLKKSYECKSVLWLNRITWKGFLKSSVPVPDLVDYVIIAPRGAPLTIPEIFLQPLTFASWMLLLVIVLISFLVMWNTGQYFRNDLLLLPICGIERYNLNETEPLEKIIVVSLMVFYFLIQSGYESIIISLISEVPFHPDIETLAHLRDNHIPVILYERDNREFFSSLLEEKNVTVILNNSTMVNSLHSGAALIHNRQSGTILVDLPGYFDSTHNRKKYNLLQDTFSAHPIVFPFLRRSMIQEIFHKHVFKVFESGLFLHWSLKRIKLAQKDANAEGENEDSDIVKFNDLAPFWAIVGVGWTLSIVVFMLERFTNVSMELKIKSMRYKQQHRNYNTKDCW